jgi:hypothetical protein
MREWDMVSRRNTKGSGGSGKSSEGQATRHTHEIAVFAATGSVKYKELGEPSVKRTKSARSMARKCYSHGPIFGKFAVTGERARGYVEAAEPFLLFLKEPGECWLGGHLIAPIPR